MLEFKRVTEIDAANLSAIAKATFYHTYSYSKTEAVMKQYMDEHFTIETLKSKVVNENIQFYFAMDEGEIIGYIKLNLGIEQTDLKDEDNLEIERLYVRHEAKGKGVGRFLCESAVQVGQSLGKKYIWLAAWEENEKAIAFYKKIGYTAFGTHPFYFGDLVENDILLKKML